MAGRRPLPPERRRSEKVWTRVTPGEKQALASLADQRKITEADAVREALTNWTKEQQ
mgnify:CR=1 FL=1